MRRDRRRRRGVRGHPTVPRWIQGRPLFAKDAATAAQLIEGLVQGVAPGAAIFLDPPTVNAEAVQLAESLGMRPVFETARMYRGEPLDLPIDEVFGITTFELG